MECLSGLQVLKNKSLETKISVFDILNQNTSVNRAVTETYIEDSKTNVLKQYFMLTVTYNIKKLKNKTSTVPLKISSSSFKM